MNELKKQKSEVLKFSMEFMNDKPNPKSSKKAQTKQSSNYKPRFKRD